MIAALRYEWRRLRSIRSTWILTALAWAQAFGLVFLITVVAASVTRGQGMVNPESMPETSLASLVPFVLYPIFPVLLSTLSAQAFGHDYRHGTIRLTLSAFPRRWQILLARVFMVLFFSVLVVLVTIATVAGLVELRSSVTYGFEWSTAAGTTGKFLVFIVLYLLLVMAITILTRILALGIVLPMVSMVFLENIISLVAQMKEEWHWVTNVLPTQNAVAWMTATDVDIVNVGSRGSLVPLSVLLVVLWAGAAWRFLGRDA